MRQLTDQAYKFIQPILKALNFTLADRIQFYECLVGNFNGNEISSLLWSLGVKRNPKTIKQMYGKQKRRVREWLANNEWYIAAHEDELIAELIRADSQN